VSGGGCGGGGLLAFAGPDGGTAPVGFAPVIAEPVLIFPP
jgi:hypothetical protein